MAEPYGVLTARCGRCGGPVDVLVESDGDGGIVDIVQPCRTCAAPKMVLRPLARPRVARALIGIKRTHPLMQLALGKARALIEQGELSVARIASLTGISQDNVRRLRREVDAETPLLCGCGRPDYHGGLCSYRRGRGERY